MGILALTNAQSETIDMRQLILFAGGSETDASNSVYNYNDEELTVPNVSDASLSTAFTNYSTDFAALELTNIEDIRVIERKKIDDAAGSKRDEYITSAAGQEMTYIRKAEDAQKYIDDGYPADATPYVWVNAEATTTGATPTQVADNIKAQNDAWIIIGTAIEGIRIGAKFGINNATTVADVRNISATAISDIGAL